MVDAKDDERFEKALTRILDKLDEFDEDDERAREIKQLVSGGIIDAAVEFIGKNRSLATLMALLASLVQEPFAQRRAVECSAVDAVVSAMKGSPDDVAVLSRSCLVLSALASGNIEFKKKVVHGGLDAILSAMNSHRDDPALQENACGALFDLACDCEENQLIMGERGAVTAAVDAMRAHGSVIDLQEAGCDAIEAILSSQQAHERFMSSAVEAAVSSASERFSRSETIRNSLACIHRSVHPVARRAVEEGTCTRSRAGEDVVPQKIFVCTSCLPRIGVCETCARTCHADHALAESFKSTFCECTSANCKAPKPPAEDVR